MNSKSEKSGVVFVPGIVAALAFVLLSAARDVAGYLALVRVPVNVVLSASFGTTVVIALAWNALSRKPGVSAFSREARPDTIWLNITTLISWLATFEGLSRLLPTTLAAVTVGMIPIATLFLDRFLRAKFIGGNAVAAALLIVLGICLISWRQIQGRFAQDQTQALLGIAISLVGAIFAAGNNVFARRLNDKGVTATGVFSGRFWLLIVVAFVWSLASRTQLPNEVNAWLLLILLGALGVAIPVMCLQYAIAQLGPRIVGYLIASIPVLVLILELFFKKHIHEGIILDWRSLGGIIAVGVGVVWGAKAPQKKQP